MEYSPVSIDSAKKAYVEFEINGKRIDTFRYIESFHFEIGSDTSWNGTINLFDPEWTYLEDLILGAKIAAGVEQGEARFRFGWLDLKSHWYTTSILSYTPTFTPTAGVALEVQFTHPTTITRNAEIFTGSFPAGTAPSIVVQTLAPYINPKFTGERLIIEPAKPYPLPIIIDEAHPLNWIQENFCKLNAEKPVQSAVRDTAGYECTIDTQDRLHFHAPGYQESSIKREYLAYRGSKGNVISFSVSDLSAFTQVAGAGKAREEMVDPKAKKRFDDLKEGEGSKQSKIEAYKKNPPNVTRRSKINTKTDKPYVDPRIIEMAVAARYEKLVSATYKADLEIIGDPFIEYNTYIRVTVLRRDNTKHYTSGIYRVVNVVHDIDMGSFTTKVSLQKLNAAERQAMGVEQGSGGRVPEKEQSKYDAFKQGYR